MTKQDHLAKAKDYIAKGEDYYRKAADEIVAAKKDDPSLSNREIGDRIGRDESWVRRLLNAADRRTPFGGEVEAGARQERGARATLRDPESRRRVLSELPAAEVEAVIEDANEVAMDRVRAKRSEHDTRPTTRDLMGDDPFRPDEFWADSVILRLNRNAGELNSLIERGGGLLLGAMEPDRALDLLEEAERKIAEARAAAQEQVQDGMRVS